MPLILRHSTSSDELRDH